MESKSGLRNSREEPQRLRPPPQPIRDRIHTINRGITGAAPPSWPKLSIIHPVSVARKTAKIVGLRRSQDSDGFLLDFEFDAPTGKNKTCSNTVRSSERPRWTGKGRIVNEYRLTKQQRDQISLEDLAMGILGILQRNHTRQTGGGSNVSYYPYQLGSILEFELVDREEASQSGIEQPFRMKFAEAVQILVTKGLIFPDPSQRNSECQIPTSKGLAVDTNGPVLGITSSEDFIRKIETQTGRLDDVARGYLSESYREAEAELWLSSTFMLGAASERLIYVLAEHISRLLADPAATTRLNNMTKVRHRKEWIVSQLTDLQRRFSPNRKAFTDVEDKFDSLYNTYRYQRNEAGHPRDIPYAPDIPQAKAMLLSFGVYCKAVYEILAIS